MKTFNQFLEESEALSKISSSWERKHPGMKFNVYQTSRPESIRVQSLEVPKEKRNKGIGTRAMKGVLNYAQKQNLPVSLTPAPEKGKKEALNRFYKRLGFKSNKGRSRDFRFSDSLIKSS